MTIAPDNARQGASPLYRAMRDTVQTLDESLPGKFEITKEGIVHDMRSPGGPHEVTAAHVSRRLEKVMPDDLLAHNGTPDVEDEPEGIMRHPDVMVIAWADLNVEGSIDPRTGSGAVFTDIHPTPDGPRYATRRDFVHGEDVTIADWTISTEGLPRYESDRNPDTP